MKLTKKQYLYMMYVWGHSFEFERNNNWEVMEEFCEMIGHRDDIWYATNIEIVDYNEAFDRLQIFADNEYIYNPSACSVWEVVVSFIILVASIIGVGMIGSSIYRMGTLRYGNPIKITTAIKSLRKHKYSSLT